MVRRRPKTKTILSRPTTWAREKGIPLFVLGGGSNLLVADAGFNGLVLHIGLKGISVRESAGSSNERVYQVAAGEDWDQLRTANR